MDKEAQLSDMDTKPKHLTPQELLDAKSPDKDSSSQGSPRSEGQIDLEGKTEAYPEEDVSVDDSSSESASDYLKETFTDPQTIKAFFANPTPPQLSANRSGTVDDRYRTFRGRAQETTQRQRFQTKAVPSKVGPLKPPLKR